MTFYTCTLLYICDFICVECIPIYDECIKLEKAADLVAKATPANLQVQAAATAESQNLQSLPLSALAVDDSGPPQVTYDYQQPIATSTPRATSSKTSEISTEAYRQILPGMSDCLYPTLVADGSLATDAPDNHGTLQTQLTSENISRKWQRGVKEMLIILTGST